jgi:hypothetical protein
MPTVLRIGALRVGIYPNDHRPPHAHVVGQGNEAVFVLNIPIGSVSLRENYGFARHELTAIARALGSNLGFLMRAWEEIHGPE